MTLVPPGTHIPFVRPTGVAGLVRAAVVDNVAGVRDAILDVVGNTRDVWQLDDGSWPTITRRSWLSYHWHAAYDPTALPNTSHGARPGDPVHGLVDTYLPGDTNTPTARPASIVEDFTDSTDGAPWPAVRWAAGLTPTGGGATVSGRAGLIKSGSAGGYAGDDAATVRALNTYSSVEVEFDFTLDAHTDAHFRVNARCDTSSLDMANGVAVAFWHDRVTAGVAADWTYTAAAEASKTHGASVTYRARVVLATQAGGGSLLRVRTWPAGQSEPATWDIDTTLATVPASGYLGFVSTGVSAAAANTTRFDSIRVYTAPPTATPAWWGSWAG